MKKSIMTLSSLSLLVCAPAVTLAQAIAPAPAPALVPALRPPGATSVFEPGTIPMVQQTLPPAAPPPAIGSPVDPYAAFNQGLTYRPMNEADIAKLRAYLDDSREKLRKALQTAKGRTSQEAIAIYEKVIREVVPTSNATAGALEFLMRMSLNQGLDLVTGVPGANRAAALRYSHNTGLKAQVLEGAIDLAIKFFMDPKALDTDALSRLPFRELGWNRLHQTLRWWGGIEDSAVALEFVERSLGHWLAIAQMARNDVPLMAQEMVDVNNILANFHQTRAQMQSMSNEELDRELRELRGQFEDLLDTLQRKAQAR